MKPTHIVMLFLITENFNPDGQCQGDIAILTVSYLVVDLALNACTSTYCVDSASLNKQGARRGPKYSSGWRQWLREENNSTEEACRAIVYLGCSRENALARKKSFPWKRETRRQRLRDEYVLGEPMGRRSLTLIQVKNSPRCPLNVTQGYRDKIGANDCPPFHLSRPCYALETSACHAGMVNATGRNAELRSGIGFGGRRRSGGTWTAFNGGQSSFRIAVCSKRC